MGAVKDGGVLITAVAPLSCAAEHLQAGDVLLQIDGVPIAQVVLI